MVNRWSLLLNLIGIFTLIFLIVSLFLDVDNQSAPLALFIGQKSIFRGDYSTAKLNYKADWAVIMAKLLGFMVTINYMVLGTYIVYYKALIKVDTMKQI